MESNTVKSTITSGNASSIEVKDIPVKIGIVAHKNYKYDHFGNKTLQNINEELCS
jgi:hypothetical protein